MGRCCLGVELDEPKAVTVVLPVYGLSHPVSAVVRDLAVAAYALRFRGMHLDVLMLDGGTGEAGKQAVGAAEPLGLPLEVIPGPATGPGNAYVEGFRRVVDAGRADLVATLDATGRHDPTQIPHLIDRLVTRDLDVVIGSRWVRGSGTPGLSVSLGLGKLANATFRMLTGTRASRMPRPASGWRGCRCSATSRSAQDPSTATAFRRCSWRWQ